MNWLELWAKIQVIGMIISLVIVVLYIAFLIWCYWKDR